MNDICLTLTILVGAHCKRDYPNDIGDFDERYFLWKIARHRETR